MNLFVSMDEVAFCGKELDYYIFLNDLLIVFGLLVIR